MKKEKTFEKKQKPYQKIAIERIHKLFEETTKTTNQKLKKRYLTLATKISKKCEVSIPKELKTTYCKKCLTTNIETKKETPFTIVKCKNCGYEKKFGNKKQNI
ncbi:MAG: ribonuclease P [Candidatus Diapherotrites archaeon]|jgi:ribonuclease P protein subunit RPR2|uniref:Ribonuclease P n=1 Tax=Candidatus Iainarchaeum sp. TaxID=3101447 RepID=A0A7K4BYR7_9ARCH|nr:ribonuclease P [Candidatus Diapherotrites archaeon]